MINADLFVEAVTRPLEFVLAAVADPVTEVGACGVHLLRGRVAPDGQPLQALLSERVEVNIHISAVILIRGQLHISLEISK